MKITAEGKTFILLILGINIYLLYQIIDNEFYSPLWVIWWGVLTVLLTYAWLGTYIPRLAKEQVEVMSDKSSLNGLYGRWVRKNPIGKEITEAIIGVPNYILPHIGKESMMRGVLDICRRESPIPIRTTESRIIHLGPDECALPEGKIYIIDGYPKIIDNKLLDRIDRLEAQRILLKKWNEDFQRLVKSIQTELTEDSRRRIETLAMTLDQLTPPPLPAKIEEPTKGGE